YGAARIGARHAVDPSYFALGAALAASKDRGAGSLHPAWVNGVPSGSLLPCRRDWSVLSRLLDRSTSRLWLYRFGCLDQESAWCSGLVRGLGVKGVFESPDLPRGALMLNSFVVVTVRTAEET